ncbi:hypothetical protein AYO40_00910 [Planctomycetaceae bacterium SCGC AG-212-D15]|nr:hypothetical protein AYO40_00910 [Planctomycetaceae bacterium SCGC AG-212-D15]
MSDYKPRCMHLCSKSIVAFGESFEQDPDHQEGDVTDYWCTRTGKGQGPDGNVVSLGLCSESRGCFQEF